MRRGGPRAPRISRLQIYATNRCDSRCRHCSIWRLRPHRDLPAAAIADLLASRSLAEDAEICLEGGEFLLHPECRAILRGLGKRPYTLLSHGMHTDRLCALVEEFDIPRVVVSLDGARAAYRRMRGVDAYDRVVETIRRLRDRTDLLVTYTAGPWNRAADYRHVRDLCARYGVRLTYPNLYTDQPYMRTPGGPGPIAGHLDPADVADVRERLFVSAHDPWLRGELVLPCRSIRTTAIVYPEGDVAFCHHRKALLGNIRRRSLDRIWGAAESERLRRAYERCNDCWCSFHRRADLLAAD